MLFQCQTVTGWNKTIIMKRHKNSGRLRHIANGAYPYQSSALSLWFININIAEVCYFIEMMLKLYRAFAPIEWCKCCRAISGPNHTCQVSDLTPFCLSGAETQRLIYCRQMRWVPAGYGFFPCHRVEELMNIFPLSPRINMKAGHATWWN